MPIFEYVCETCEKRTEVFIRNTNDRPVCSCGSKKMKKLLSPFAVSQANPSRQPGCSSGNCGIPSSPCSSGMCGLS